MLKKFSDNISKRIKGLWGREERKDKELKGLDGKELEIFSYETLLDATSSMLQRGGFGSIFKGKLKDGRKIRVENLSVNSAQGRVEFMELVNLLGGVHHSNVLKLLGYCTQYDKSFLVYEHGGQDWKWQLNWRERYEIMIDMAKGLSYLHGGSGNGIIIHPDITPTNILIDRNKGNPKISGFCLGCPLLNHEILDNTYLIGTCGHMAPECIKKRHVSTKTNVYSFGVLVLELISGKDNSRPLSNALRRWQLVSPKALDLVDWAHQLYEENKSLEMMDSTLTDSAITEQLANCLKIGLLCTQHDPLQRPNMDNVVSMLIGNQVPMEIQIVRPRFLLNGDESKGEVYNIEVETPDHMPMDEHQIQDHAQDNYEGHKNENLKEKIAAHSCQHFSYETLYGATNKFASQNVLGQGGFGLVYKGKLDDGREIAVKKSSKVSEERMKTLVREVELLSRLKHPNVVKLLGYCTEDNNFLLVYEYVPNRSLHKFLFGSNGREKELDWGSTYGIIIGITKGLSYLHADPQNCIIHRDIKAENILLHHKWVPKIGDFGISRLFPVDQTHVYTSAVGTWGHIAPEYLDHGHVSTKTDVYSFGVLVLQLVSGKRYSFMPPQEDNAIGLLDWVYKLFKVGRISDIMDPVLANSVVIEELENCIEIGLRCTQGDPKSRPDMEAVMFMLNGNNNHGHRELSICRPGIYGYRGHFTISFSDVTQNQGNESTEVQIDSSCDGNSSTFLS